MGNVLGGWVSEERVEMVEGRKGEVGWALIRYLSKREMEENKEIV